MAPSHNHSGEKNVDSIRRCPLTHLFSVSAAAQRRGGEGAPAGRGHPSAAEEPAEEGRLRTAVHGRGRLGHLRHHAVRHAHSQRQQAAGERTACRHPILSLAQTFSRSSKSFPHLRFFMFPSGPIITFLFMLMIHYLLFQIHIFPGCLLMQLVARLLYNKKVPVFVGGDCMFSLWVSWFSRSPRNPTVRLIGLSQARLVAKSLPSFFPHATGCEYLKATNSVFSLF